MIRQVLLKFVVSKRDEAAKGLKNPRQKGRGEMKLFAQRCYDLGTENAFKVGPYIAEAETKLGMRVIRCNLGEPDFEVPEYIRNAVKDAIDKGMTHYCDPQGILSLRQAIARTMGLRRGLKISPDQVVVFPGAKPPIGFCEMVYCNSGEEVVYPSPGFPIYESFIRFVGAIPRALYLNPRDEFTFSGQQLSLQMNAKTKLVILNFPSNPTGGVATQEQLTHIAEAILGLGRNDIRVYSDEVYEDILFDGRHHFSIASVPGMEKLTIIVSGVSKSYAWTGGRVGWAIFPTVEEARMFKMFNINFFSCVPAFTQMGAQVALEDRRSKLELARMVAEFQRRRDFIVPALNRISGIACQNPGGAFYVFPAVESLCHHLGIIKIYNGLPEVERCKTSPSTLLQMFLLYCYGVATMDRKSFGSIGVEDSHFLRISFATSMDELKLAVERIRRAAFDVNGFSDYVASGGRLY